MSEWKVRMPVEKIGPDKAQFVLGVKYATGRVELSGQVQDKQASAILGLLNMPYEQFKKEFPQLCV